MSELRLETWSMPAADLGPENPLPPLRHFRELHAIESAPGIPEAMLANMAYGHVPNTLPYAMQDGYARALQERAFRVAVLENETLRATFLLEFGGRLWSLVHKPSGRELLSVNPVLQLANLAIRNAWFCGGVEWNIGTIGHSPFTCAPLFAARVTGAEGAPVLRLYEWERIRQTPFQIDAFLPDGSPVLFVRVQITNPHPHETPMYWWSNIAVPESPETRVVAPADAAYRFGYKRTGLMLIPVPEFEGVDFTYTTNVDHAADFFFHIPDDARHWIAALDAAGRGLVQVSTRRLVGRKLFLWGTGPGGRKWQRFLAPTAAQGYLEIQAGLARTQMEHLAMPSGATWSWLEAYGLLEADADAVHGVRWADARGAVSDALERLIPRARLDAVLERSARLADAPPDALLQRGSGWGALERVRRAHDGESALLRRRAGVRRRVDGGGAGAVAQPPARRDVPGHCAGDPAARLHGAGGVAGAYGARGCRPRAGQLARLAPPGRDAALRGRLGGCTARLGTLAGVRAHAVGAAQPGGSGGGGRPARRGRRPDGGGVPSGSGACAAGGGVWPRPDRRGPPWCVALTCAPTCRSRSAPWGASACSKRRRRWRLATWRARRVRCTMRASSSRTSARARLRSRTCGLSTTCSASARRRASRLTTRSARACAGSIPCRTIWSFACPPRPDRYA
ncbi:MAG: DUF5107 domain-containing protein [Anaerolineae bacterium]|nr:DUF5107 domain-containing protein [Anaerolineae bacterium]